MPLTTDDIAQIKEAFGIAPDSTLKETLGLTEIQKTLVSFEKKLTEVDNKLSEKLLAVETSNRELTLSIQAVKTHNEKTFAELRSADTNLEQNIESKDAQINVLTNRLHQLSNWNDARPTTNNMAEGGTSKSTEYQFRWTTKTSNVLFWTFSMVSMLNWTVMRLRLYTDCHPKLRRFQNRLLFVL